MSAWKFPRVFPLAALLPLLCAAAEPTAVAPAAGNPLEAAVEAASKLTADEALVKARELRAKVESGDAQAAFEFTVLLSRFGRFGPQANPAHGKDWNELAGDKVAIQWMGRAAELGHPQAVELVCRLAEDRLAPQFRRDTALASCEAGQKKLAADGRGG